MAKIKLQAVFGLPHYGLTCEQRWKPAVPHETAHQQQSRQCAAQAAQAASQTSVHMCQGQGGMLWNTGAATGQREFKPFGTVNHVKPLAG